MKELNLYRVWEILNRMCWYTEDLSEKNIYVDLLGNRSNYCAPDYKEFLNYYSFKIEKSVLCIFNDDGVPYEDYTVGDFSYLPLNLLSLTDNEIKTWLDEETEKRIKYQEEEKSREKENIKQQIEQLQKRLESL